MEENYLAKWLNGELPEAELKAFRESSEYKTYERIARVSGKLEGPDFDVEAALARVKAERSSPGGKVVRMKPAIRWLRIAAAVVLMLAAGYFYVNTLDERFEAAYAQRQEVRLPDASQVVLNAGSELTYNEKSWDENRHVRLAGEAFFKVAKGKSFTVETKSGDVTVLGTQFNVLQRGDIFEVSCFEGLVRVSHNGTAVELPAGKSYRLLAGETSEAGIPDSGSPSWIRGESAFRSMPLSFVLDEFRRQYDMDVETRGLDLSRRFTGTISNTNMNLALQSISAPLQIKFEVEGNKVLLYAENAR